MFEVANVTSVQEEFKRIWKTAEAFLTDVRWVNAHTSCQWLTLQRNASSLTKLKKDHEGANVHN